MNRRVLAAGWPFAGLLTLEPSRSTVSASARLSGVVIDGGSGALAIEPGDAAGTFDLDAATPLYGVDGYPISLDDLGIGDVVQVVQGLLDSRWVTTAVRVLMPGSQTA